MNATGLDQVFGAVSDATRRAILARLAQSSACVTEIADAFPIALNSTSMHIKVLERAGLVHRERRGREHILSLNASAFEEAADWIEFYRQFWDQRLDALEDFLVKSRPGSESGDPK